MTPRDIGQAGIGDCLYVSVTEPDVSPLAVQGPKAEALLVGLSLMDKVTGMPNRASPCTVAMARFGQARFRRYRLSEPKF